MMYSCCGLVKLLKEYLQGGMFLLCNTAFHLVGLQWCDLLKDGCTRGHGTLEGMAVQREILIAWLYRKSTRGPSCTVNNQERWLQESTLEVLEYRENTTEHGYTEFTKKTWLYKQHTRVQGENQEGVEHTKRHTCTESTQESMGVQREYERAWYRENTIEGLVVQKTLDGLAKQKTHGCTKCTLEGMAAQREHQRAQLYRESTRGHCFTQKVYMQLCAKTALEGWLYRDNTRACLNKTNTTN